MQLKGRVACEINTCDELIATEMVFENVLDSLDPPEIAGWSTHFCLGFGLPRQKMSFTKCFAAIQSIGRVGQPAGEARLP